MIVPQFWAEARYQQRVGKRQITVRRFGWSDQDLVQAQQHADERARAAMARIQAGEALQKREPKLPYNGADGLPIREEIVSRSGDTIITRNAYGALCLNSENVLFADVDFENSVPGRWPAVVNFVGVMLAILIGVSQRSWLLGLALGFAVLLLSFPLAQWLYRFWLARTGGAERRARQRIHAFSAANPSWHLRLYRTPLGFRVLAMHRTFDPTEADVTRCFEALNTDVLYRQMCRNQRCFRARVSPKPWRIGISAHLRPRPGVWPVAPERLPDRQRWVEHYQARAQEFAACRFVEQLGSQSVHPDTLAVQRLHDELSRATSNLAIA